jgi:polyhydroxybutyrate depolymerase
VNDLTRPYLLHVPDSYKAGAPMPLVFVLHGATQSPESAERMSEMSTLSDEYGFIAVYPRGTGRLPTWNSGGCCAYAMEQKIDDVAFIRALIARLEHEYSVDPKRIYATGISNGAMMVYRPACELSDKIAAIAPVEGAQDIECRPSNPVSVIVFHGTADRLVPFHGGSTPYQMGSKRSDTPVMDTVCFWVERDGCSFEPEHSKNRGARVSIYSGCKDGTGVAMYAVEGGRHMCPGRPISGNALPASELMWGFFVQHPKQSVAIRLD